MGIMKLLFSKKAQEELAGKMADEMKALGEGTVCPHCRAEMKVSDDTCPSCQKPVTGACPRCGARKHLAALKCEVCGEVFLDVIEKYKMVSL